MCKSLSRVKIVVQYVEEGNTCLCVCVYKCTCLYIAVYEPSRHIFFPVSVM